MGKKIILAPNIIKKMRMNSGYTIGEVAKKMRMRAERYEKIENNEIAITRKQIEKLSKIFHYNLAAFFSQSIPDLPPVKIMTDDGCFWVNIKEHK